MTCKDCYFYENQCLFQNGKEFTVSDRKCFKDKTRIVELPCKIGDVVYSPEHDLDCDIIIEAIVITKDYIRFEWTQYDYSLGLGEQFDEGLVYCFRASICERLREGRENANKIQDPGRCAANSTGIHKRA